MGALDDDLPVLAVEGADLRQASTVVQVEPVKQLHAIGRSVGQKTQPRAPDAVFHQFHDVPWPADASSGEAAG